MDKKIVNSYVNQTFQDFDYFADTLKFWNVKITQLHRGKTESQLTQFNTENMIVSAGLFRGITQQQGDPPPFGCTVAILSDTISNLTWQKKEVLPNGIMIMPSSSELDVVTKDRVGVYTISLTGETLRSIVISSGLDKLLKKNELISAPLKDMNELRNLIGTYSFLLNQNSALVSNIGFTDEINMEISSKIAHLLTKGRNFSESPRSFNKANKWKRIENFLEEFHESYFKIADICLATDISERTLLRLFRDRFNVSPKVYINMLRLNGLHRDLRSANTCNNKICDIANYWGFWHMGQMASDYKTMFGELPSQTLKSS